MKAFRDLAPDLDAARAAWEAGPLGAKALDWTITVGLAARYTFDGGDPAAEVKDGMPALADGVAGKALELDGKRYLHAGDVGLLSTLDRLSVAAPVVAVHGNDERYDEAPRELPYQQVVAVAGQRIVLTHAHYPDLHEEMASRREDRWAPKLARRAAFGHRALW